MGIFATLLYVFAAYTGLAVLFPALATARIEILIAILALLCSLPFLPGSSGVHYDHRNSGLRATKGNTPMDLTDRLLENDYWAKKRLLESALSLTDQQLDAPLAFRHNLVPFAEPERNLREALGRMTGDIWAVALLQELKWPTENDFYRVNRDPKTVPTTAQQVIFSLPQQLLFSPLFCLR